MFPIINHINDVLPCVEGDSAFRISEKDCGHTYINYNHMGTDVFPPIPTDEEWTRAQHDAWENHCLGQEHERAILRRECRGIAFNTTTGLIASRPFHKFFNAGERDEVALNVLPFSDHHMVMDKVDGSMLRPILTRDAVRWGTKMGVTDVALIAEKFINSQPNVENTYVGYAMHCGVTGMTPIFEFVSPENQIVVDYGEPNLILLAVRNNVTGQYLTRDVLEAHANTYNLPLVKVHSYAHGANGAHFVDAIRTSDLDEGVVVMWPSGLMSKVKTEAYTRLHAAKDKMATERRTVSVIMEDQVDDLLAMLREDERDRLQKFVDQFWLVVDELASYIEINYRLIRNTHDDKKSFALSDFAQQNPHMRSVTFALWDGKTKSPMEAAHRIIEHGLSSETKWKDIKEQWALDLDWKETEIAE